MQMNFVRYTSELSISPKQKDRHDSQQLHNDFNRARSRIWLEMVAKLSHFQQLPYKLLQLGHHDKRQRILGAQCCLLLWKHQGIGCKHRQSRRFLDPDWVGTEGDPSLLPLVCRLARGEDIFESADFAPFLNWTCRFTCIRLAERSVEGVHSLMTRAVKRAPRSCIPYLSVELRFEGFWSDLCKDPPVARQQPAISINIYQYQTYHT